MIDTELILAMKTVFQEETENLRKDLSKEIQTTVQGETENLRKDLSKEIANAVLEGTKDLREQLNKLDTKVQNMEIKFGIELGELRCQMEGVQKNIKLIKEYPYNVESRLSKVEQNQLELMSMIINSNAKHA